MTEQNKGQQRLVVGVSGASGAVISWRLLETLARLGIETHLVVTRTGALTLSYETDYRLKEMHALATQSYKIEDQTAAIASGSFQTRGMIVAPCSVRTLGEIANGIAGNLLTRAADVTLKERRPLVLMLREAPLSLIHIQNMEKVTAAGGIIFPPVPAFYAKPASIDDMVDHLIARALDLFNLEAGGPRWGEN